MLVRANNDCDGISHTMTKGQTYDVPQHVAKELLLRGDVTTAEGDFETATVTSKVETTESRNPTKRTKGS